MTREPPEYCPYCGTALSPVDPPSVHFCDSCDDHVFYHPTPCSRLAVLDGDALLLVKVDLPDRNLWGTPGGMVEVGEDPDEAAARELREETTLVVDPDALVFFDATTFPKFDRFHKTYLCYAVDVADVTGTPQADDEVADVRYFTAEAFAATDGRLLTSWPRAYKRFEWWVENARLALADA